MRRRLNGGGEKASVSLQRRRLLLTGRSMTYLQVAQPVRVLVAHFFVLLELPRLVLPISMATDHPLVVVPLACNAETLPGDF